MAPVLRKRKIEKDRKTTAPSEEGEMAVVDPVTVNNNRKIGWCKARRKAIKMSCIADILPQEVIFAILLLLPVDFIYHVVRYVCRGWYNIIRSPSVAHSHLHNSSSSNTCLFLQSSFYHTPKSGYFLRTTNTGTIEFKRLGFVPHGVVMSSCNGLLYFPKHEAFEPCVLNPVTGQQVVLPFYKFRTCRPGTNHFLAYSPVSRVYKIAQLISYAYNATPRFAILTLGGVEKKKWRRIDASHLGLHTCYFRFPPLCIGRFMYYFCDPQGMSIVVFDIEIETLWSISFPTSDWRDPKKFLAMWGSLSMMVKVNSYLIKTWLLIDPKTGRWEKLPDINFVASSRLRYHRMPIGSLGNGELLVFEESSEIIVYHVKMGRIVASYQPDDKEYPACMYKWRCHPHVDSLVSLSPATTTAKPVEAYKK
ncbi:unnamed protein product [Cuscuta campestris]|uniref:Uncharacterized protein n=1 Tax=Cuscuta campestris TaxID=132261 RepID=A0A484LWD3_9ASTE|nr:unnamed protein product [Cuscuta campestris]